MIIIDMGSGHVHLFWNSTDLQWQEGVFIRNV